VSVDTGKRNEIQSRAKSSHVDLLESSYLVSAGEFQVMEDWEIDVHHYEAHQYDSTHDVEILNAINVDFRRRTQQ
jgi:hypothetical protein